jgi:hypothetical protein
VSEPAGPGVRPRYATAEPNVDDVLDGKPLTSICWSITAACCDVLDVRNRSSTASVPDVRPGQVTITEWVRSRWPTELV